MTTKITILLAYFAGVLLVGLLARTRWRSTPETYFLADRRLGTVILLGTMVATNFSAFTVFGCSGAGYRDGYAFFPIMGFGTGFMALTFWILGRRIWQVGRDRGLVTPPELVREIYQSRSLAALFSTVMIVFTIPYLALQPMAAGYALETLIGLPYGWGCTLVTGIILAYTLRGGLRAVAWTDLLQGTLMLGLLIVSLVLVVRHHGGLAVAHERVFAIDPELFARPGGQGRYTVGIWFSYLALWYFCDPMFPQLFQRFFTARDRRVLSRVMLFYPVICTVVFFLPVAVGVLGHLSHPDLAGKEADRILPLVITTVSGDAMAAVVIAAGLAALMSTMDSQLLTLSSIFSRDLVPLFRRTAAPGGGLAGRLFVAVLALVGLAMALRPPDTILEIATRTFTGLAVLFPTVIFGLYLRRVFAAAAILSIVAGEMLLALFHWGVFDAGPVLPVVWIMLAAFAVYLTVHALALGRRGEWHVGTPRWLRDPFFWIFAGLFGLAIDFWAWGVTGPRWWGLPTWVGWFVLLSGVQTLAMVRLVRSRE